MLFDDEKDYNIEDEEITISDDDGSVAWEDVLGGSDDDIILPNPTEAKPSAAPKAQAAPSPVADTEEIDEIGSVSSEAFEFDDNDLIGDDDDEDVSDDVLARILSDSQEGGMDDMDDDIDIPRKQDEYTHPVAAGEDEGLDIDGQLASVILDGEEEEEQQAPREYHLHENKQEQREEKEIEIQKPQGELKKVLLVFVTLVVVLSLYFFFKGHTSGSNVATGDLEYAQNQQEAMNELTQGDIAARAQESEIPIINEEELASIQPDEKEQKKTIEVTPTGRANPFMPLQKYIAVGIPTTEITFSDSVVPLPPSSYGVPDERIDKMITIAVSGIMYDAQKPSAIISYDGDDYFVQRGDKLDDYKVLDITKNYVVLALGRNTYKATVGEQFKITQDFGGSATYLKDGRQYHSVEFDAQREELLRPANGSNNSGSNTSRYVSEKDVQINPQPQTGGGMNGTVNRVGGGPDATGASAAATAATKR